MAHCLGFAGYSNSGKTTLIAKLVLEMKLRGHRIAVMKHDAHGHYKEVEGTDSATFVSAGADVVVTLSPSSIHVYEQKETPSLEEHLLAYTHLDYIFIEGFKKEKYPKIAVYRTLEQQEQIQAIVPSPIAVATDLHVGGSDYAEHSYDLNDIVGIADFIETYFKGN